MRPMEWQKVITLVSLHRYKVKCCCGKNKAPFAVGFSANKDFERVLFAMENFCGKVLFRNRAANAVTAALLKMVRVHASKAR